MTAQYRQIDSGLQNNRQTAVFRYTISTPSAYPNISGFVSGAVIWQCIAKFVFLCRASARSPLTWHSYSFYKCVVTAGTLTWLYTKGVLQILLNLLLRCFKHLHSCVGSKEQQELASNVLQVAVSDKLCSLVSAVDLGLRGQVHPPNKFELAARLVRCLVLLLCISVLGLCLIFAR